MPSFSITCRQWLALLQSRRQSSELYPARLITLAFCNMQCTASRCRYFGQSKGSAGQASMGASSFAYPDSVLGALKRGDKEVAAHGPSQMAEGRAGHLSEAHCLLQHIASTNTDIHVAFHHLAAGAVHGCAYELLRGCFLFWNLLQLETINGHSSRGS